MAERYFLSVSVSFKEVDVIFLLITAIVGYTMASLEFLTITRRVIHSPDWIVGVWRNDNIPTGNTAFLDRPMYSLIGLFVVVVIVCNDAITYASWPKS